MPQSRRLPMGSPRWSLPKVLGLSALLSGASMSAGAAGSSAYQLTLDLVRQTAADFALSQVRQHDGESLTVSTGRLDPRLRLKRCHAGMEAFRPNASRTIGAGLVGVRCLGPSRWTVYVPVDVAVETSVLVVHRGVGRGQPVDAGDVRIETRRVSRLQSGYFSEVGQLEGFVAKRHIQAGTVLSPAMLRLPRIVRRGDLVTLFIDQGTIKITAPGESRSDGARGDIVRVVNAKTGKRLRGRVIGKGRIEVL